VGVGVGQQEQNKRREEIKKETRKNKDKRENYM
jgi:hypothetical protein